MSTNKGYSFHLIIPETLEQQRERLARQVLPDDAWERRKRLIKKVTPKQLRLFGD